MGITVENEAEWLAALVTCVLLVPALIAALVYCCVKKVCKDEGTGLVKHRIIREERVVEKRVPAHAPQIHREVIQKPVQKYEPVETIVEKPVQRIIPAAVAPVAPVTRKIVESPTRVVQSTNTNLLEEAKSIGRPYFGFALIDKGPALYVQTIYENSPAWKAGLRVGDHIREVGHTVVTDHEHVHQAIRASKPGQQVRVVASRNDGKPFETKLAVMTSQEKYRALGNDMFFDVNAHHKME